MEAIAYLYKKSFKNRVKKALHKPVTVIYSLLVIAYLVWMYFVFQDMFNDLKMNTPEGLVVILTAMVLFMMPGNLFTFVKQKGLIFRKSDVHFLFASPISPKQVLLYGYIRNLISGLVLGVVLIPIGVVWFHIPIYKMILYFMVSEGIENILMLSIMTLLYGNERLKSKTRMWLGRIFLLFIGAVVIIGAYQYFAYDRSFMFIYAFLASPYLHVVPIIGWAIATYRLIFIGATTVNVICASLYLATTIVLGIMAYRMRCTGEYYEHAMKFADDYEEAKIRGAKGEVTIVGAKKAKLKKASITYKGYYAKAIFYRQLLEYKKKKFFIFGFYNVICLVMGVVMAFFTRGESGAREYAIFVAAGAGAYCTILFSGFQTKWAKELENPYTFLIPDSPIRKLWYATIIEHIRAIIDGLLITVPIAIVLHMSLINIVFSVLIYVCLQANKLYLSVLSEALLGNTLGAVGKQMLRFLMLTISILAGVFTAIGLGSISTIEIAFLGLMGVEILLTAGIAVAASVLFKKMEM